MYVTMILHVLCMCIISIMHFYTIYNEICVLCFQSFLMLCASPKVGYISPVPQYPLFTACFDELGVEMVATCNNIRSV